MGARGQWPVRLWRDVPDSERVDREFIEGCGGANPEQWPSAKDPEKAAAAWVEKRLSALDRPVACAAARRWYASRKWTRCSQRVAPGEEFCFRHGGAHPPKPVYVKKSADPQWVAGRLERRRARIEAKIADLQAQLDAIAKATGEAQSGVLPEAVPPQQIRKITGDGS